MKYLVFLIVAFSLLACNRGKNGTTQNTAIPNTVQLDSTYRFSVSFISIGAGTDIKAKEQFDHYINAYEQKNNLKLAYMITRWGREGEVDYYFRLTEMDKKKQDQFIAETKEVLKNSVLVRYGENVECRQSRH